MPEPISGTKKSKGSAAGRRSPFARVSRPPPIALQPRDEAIIEAVYRYGLLSGEQLQRLIGFGCAPRRNIRLRALFDHGYLARRFLPTLQGSARPLYVLGHKGVEVVIRRLGLDPQEVRRQAKAAREAKDLFLLHRLQVNEVRLAFTLATAKHSEMKMDSWRNTPALDGVHLIPDAYCRYWYREHIWSVFLELDRATESHRRIKAKVEAYLHFGLSGLYQRQFGMKFFRVLVVTTSEAHLIGLKRTVEGLTDKMFWFATLMDIAPETVFGRIWRRPRSDGRFALHDED